LRSITKDWDGFPRFGKNKEVKECGRRFVNRSFSPLFAIGTPLVLLGAQPASSGTDFREEDMIDTGKLGQMILATVGAMVLTATAVGAAVGPARAIETAPISLVAVSVSGQAQA
jgi:hypothetical protein